MTLQQYLTKVEILFKTGNAREHSYRGDLQNLIMAILPDVLVTNEPARVDCGAPDYVLTRKDIPIGYIEAKDIGIDLGSKTLKEQFERYKSGLSNLIFTDYLDFHFYKNGEFVTKIAIARIEKTTPPDGHPSKGGELIPMPENFEQFTQLIKNFAETVSQSIKSPTKLAQMMAGKAKLMADVIEKSLNYDDQEGKRSQIKSQMLSFQQMLIHDIDNKSFADIYSQTIAYGMFAARYHDPTLPTFSRMEAAELIPKSNPFLRKLFQDIAGFDLDIRLTWIVDELINIFLASDVATIMRNFGKSTKQEDPVVHFYETFLGEYNPALRKARGVWYTPQPVVNFIVRAVDDILKTEFDLPQGLADTSKTKIKKKTVTQSGTGMNSKIKEVETEVEIHKVQILDPATGTGTFLAEVVKHIHKKFEGQQGIWSKYVTNDLIPRLNGFELLMASYAMAHLKMDMLLTETGYKPTDDQRFRIFLTNSLEEAHPDTATLFSSWLSDEADQANAIKRDAPVMVVMGNPPYSGESSNKGEWIMNLMEDYKKEPGGKEKLKERNPKWINDDYVKFMRFGQHFIDKNGSGILAFINPHGFLDNPTFRGMRWNLLKTYDKIYTIDLHGNTNKKEVSPDGSIDQNVFDIQQGVSINILIKTGRKPKNDLGKIFNFDLYGKREDKYDFLVGNSLNKINFNEISATEPNFTFINKNFEVFEQYSYGFSLSDLFVFNSVGIVTSRDGLVVDIEKNVLHNRMNEFFNNDENYCKNILKVKENSSFNINFIKQKTTFSESYIKPISYRPFDDRYIYFDSLNFIERSRGNLINHFENQNYSIVFRRQQPDSNDLYIFTSKQVIADGYIRSDNKGGESTAPLYLYNDADLLNSNSRIPNLNPTIIKQIAECLRLTFTNEKEETPNTFAPIDLLDYIYSVLHSPNYREKYKEFLKIDFPRVPYPKDSATFWQLVKLGGELRQIHLLESPIVEKYITQYPEDGDNIVTKPRFENSPPLEGCPSGGVVPNTTSQKEINPHAAPDNFMVPDTFIKDNPIYFNPILELPYNIKLKARAKELRQAENLSEVLFWMQVTKDQFYNIDFDRQRIIGNYIVDFYVKKLGLVIEIDGASHDTKAEYDKSREDYLLSLGLKVYRIPVVEVLQNMKGAMRNLEEYIIENYGKPLLNSSKVKNPPHPSGTPPKEGNLAQLTKKENMGRVYINENQYFANVPEVAWNFYIGGYQPCQKWLKDRKGRELNYDDILHYQKIVVALSETDRIMRGIDKIEI